jgi:crotonobetainyl-CoA:carnitine CoA-transferase CaiB-like acyl-CoA transferase
MSSTFMVPYASLLMAQMGAEVIKVEEPDGDILRRIGDTTGTGLGPIFINANRGKKSVVLDVRTERDHGRLIQLVGTADVFVHNRTPAAARRLRIDYDSLCVGNPRLIHCGAFGYGSDGPYADLPAYDDVIQAASGFSYVQTNGREPQYVRTAVTDKACGLFILAAILAALFEREKSKLGQAVEVPMFESMVSFLFLEQQGGAVFDPPRGPTGYARTSSPHRHPYRTSDGLVSVMVYTDRQWRGFFEVIGRPELTDDPRFATIGARTENIDALYALLEQELLLRPTDEWLAILQSRRVPAVKVNSISGLLDDPHVVATGLLERSVHHVVGPIRTARLPIKFGRTVPRRPSPAPTLGEHNALLDGLRPERKGEADGTRQREPAGE